MRFCFMFDIIVGGIIIDWDRLGRLNCFVALALRSVETLRRIKLCCYRISSFLHIVFIPFD